MVDSRRSPPPAANAARPPLAPAAGGGPGAGEDSSPRPSYGVVLDHLEKDMEALRLACEKFLAGVERRPPEGDRQGIAAQLRRLRASPPANAAELFRLGGLEARFNSQMELYHRRLRQQEEGRGPLRPAPAVERPRFDPAAGIVVAGQPGEREAAALFQAAVERGVAGTSLDPSRFAAWLADQTAAIRAKTGCAAVQFRLAEEADGRVKLKARPLASAAPGA